DAVYPALVLVGALALRAAPARARLAVHATLLGGVALLLLRYTLPNVFRDAKDMEMLAPAVAVLSAAALCRLARRGPAGRLLAALAGAVALAFGVQQAAAIYAERFVAVAR